MDSLEDLYDDSPDYPQNNVFDPNQCTAVLPGNPQSDGGWPPISSGSSGYPLIHHLFHPGGAPKRGRGQLPLTSHNPNLGFLPYRTEQGEESDGRVEEGIKENDERGRSMEQGLFGTKRRSTAALVAEWNDDIVQVKRMKVQRDGEREADGGREWRRKEREELKEQLEEARERLQALQEKVWRVFGEKRTAEEERKTGHRKEKQGGGEGDRGAIEEEYKSLCLLPAFPFNNLQGPGKRREGGEGRAGSGTPGGLCLEGGPTRRPVWLGGGGLVTGEWDEGMVGSEGEGEEGGQKFAQALKLELGSTVARVIDRVLRLYADTTEFSPPSPGLAQTAHEEEGRATGGWMGERAEASRRDGIQKEIDRERQRLKTANGSPTPGQSHCEEQPTDQVTPAIGQSHDKRKATLILQPHLPPSHHSLVLRHPSLPRPSLLSPPSQSKVLSSSYLSSSSSSFPPPPALPTSLPLPLLHYSMQQLFSRSLSDTPHLPASHKEYLSSHPFLELQPHLSSHASFLPLPLLGHLDHSLAPHLRGDRERDRGMRGDGGLEGGELYLPPGGTQEGLSPCHLKKAKLMFFYARYPSSNTLKTYFPDVKFNRCVTSQLIKWFSNFREFFYIQMERFARQAVREALTRDGASCLGRESQLHMGRDTELYRILNLHYNKSNVYQVPEKFIEVSEVALREFYSAIWTGRDTDPCWKKGIYKIVCKLDSPVPDTFRLPGCPVG